MTRPTTSSVVTVVLLCAAAVSIAAQQQPQQDTQVFRFKTGVELINVTATVTDRNGRFVSGLEKQDFRLFDDGLEQQITHFNAERVPVSLGLVVDTSGSMEGEKWLAARQALLRFLVELLDDQDEVFLYRFDNRPELVEDWTSDRQRIASALGRIRPRGATSLYDAVADAIPLAQKGRNRKKALVVISDGNDTNSRTTIQELKQMIRETEVLVYAIGIDSQDAYFPVNRWPTRQITGLQSGPRSPVPMPFPMPGRRNPPASPPRMPPPGPPPTPNPGPPSSVRGRLDDRVNVAALRDITDDSGGRTEIVRSTRDLGPATSGIADELSRQYYLGYPAQGKKDGRWHTIRVDVRGNHMVRARRGYVATQ
jgi:VWFA-related protein